MFGFDSIFGTSPYPSKPRLQSRIMLDRDLINAYMAHLGEYDQQWISHLFNQVAIAIDKNKDKDGMIVEVLKVDPFVSSQATAAAQWVLEYIGYRVHYRSDDLVIAWWNDERPAAKTESPADQPAAPSN